jgi:DNA polymerase-3 subunit alpha
MCFYYHEHELAHINKERYGLIDYYDLPEEPVVDNFWHKNGREIPIYKLYRVYGTVIAKNKSKGDVTLLGPNGVFNVWCNKEFFAMFDKQISDRRPDGTKKIIEKSWFHRGTMLVFTGMKRGDEFIPKKYANTPGHLIYRIDEINKDGSLIMRATRAQGVAEEEEE